MNTTRVKVCGITRFEDAEACVAEGVDTLGLNFWHGTKRRISLDVARRIVEAFSSHAEIVGVFVDETLEGIRATKDETGIEWVQLHGDEPPELVAALLPKAFKAIGVRSEDPLAEVRRYPGEHVLLDAMVQGAMPGGTGVAFDWKLACAVAHERKLTLAGGLRPENVGEAIRIVRPYRIDVASGVELAPGIKDRARVRALVAAVREADRARPT